MRTPESVLKWYLEGALTHRNASGLLARKIDAENVDRVMRSLPPRLFQEMRIEAGFEDWTKVVCINLDPPEPFRIAVLQEWLSRNGYRPVRELRVKASEQPPRMFLASPAGLLEEIGRCESAGFRDFEAPGTAFRLGGGVLQDRRQFLGDDESAGYVFLDGPTDAQEGDSFLYRVDAAMTRRWARCTSEERKAAAEATKADIKSADLRVRVSIEALLGAFDDLVALARLSEQSDQAIFVRETLSYEIRRKPPDTQAPSSAS